MGACSWRCRYCTLGQLFWPAMSALGIFARLPVDPHDAEREVRDERPRFSPRAGVAFSGVWHQEGVAIIRRGDPGEGTECQGPSRRSAGRLARVIVLA